MPGGVRDSRSLAERLFAVLDAFEGASTGALTLTQIALRTSLPMSTAHRLTARLTDWGALERTAEGDYQVGLKLWRLGTRYPTAQRLRQTALPYLEDLLELTRQNVQIAVRDGTGVLYLDRLNARESIPVLADVGRRLPLHSTGVGLVLLAWGPEELLDEVIASRPRKYLPATMTTREELAPRLAQIRREGLVFTRDEMTLDSSSIAAPIRDATGEVVAAISVIGPSADAPDPQSQAAVRLAARGASHGLGWVPPKVGG